MQGMAYAGTHGGPPSTPSRGILGNLTSSSSAAAAGGAGAHGGNSNSNNNGGGNNLSRRESAAAGGAWEHDWDVPIPTGATPFCSSPLATACHHLTLPRPSPPLARSLPSRSLPSPSAQAWAPSPHTFSRPSQ
jgi:hypothetical protein